jgi:hypothetical protein
MSRKKRAINPLIVACPERAEGLPLQDAFRTVDWKKIREELNNFFIKVPVFGKN